MFTLMDYFKSDPGSDLLVESGKRIVKRRKALKIKQSVLLEYIRLHTGIKSRTVISEWEHGKRKIESLGQLAALADILQCDPEYITCQCDTLRKEYSDPVSRFGLSEESFAVLESDFGKEMELRILDSRFESYFNPKEAFQNGIYTSSVIDFILEHKSILDSFKTILNQKESEAKLLKMFPGKSFGDHVENNCFILPDPQMPVKKALVSFPKTELAMDSYGQYLVTASQAAFIAEQQLIAEIRKALDEPKKG